MLIELNKTTSKRIIKFNSTSMGFKEFTHVNFNNNIVARPTLQPTCQLKFDHNLWLSIGPRVDRVVEGF